MSKTLRNLLDPSPTIRVNAYADHPKGADWGIHDPNPDVVSDLMDEDLLKSHHYDELVHHKNPNIRADVAFYGNDSHRDKLINDPDPNVRSCVAKRGNNQHRDQLINDPNTNIRCYVAERGNNQHRDQLINDPDPNVRYCVAQFGNLEHANKLRDDPDVDVKNAAIRKINHLTIGKRYT